MSDVLIARTCSACGQSFGATGLEHKCSNCRGNPRGVENYLSSREQQVIALVKQAKTNREIAHELCLSTGTIKEYLFHIFRKLKVTNRTELALLTLPPQEN